MPKNKKIMSNEVIAWGIALFIAISQGYLFLSGYRLSADDVMYQAKYMEGYKSIVEFTVSAAYFQGRIGNFLNATLLLVGAYYADSIAFRIFYTALFFLNFLIFSIYISVLLNRRIALFLFIVMVIFNPLGYNLSPPNAYPLFLTIPFFLILSCRLVLLKNHFTQLKLRGLTRILLLIIFGVSMLATEYAFIFGLMLLIAEFFAEAFKPGARFSIQAAALWLRSSWTDWFTVFSVFALTIGFRLAFPSQYDGNVPNGLASPLLIMKTILAHIYFGLSIAPSTTFQGMPILIGPILSLPPIQILVAASMFIFAFAAIYMATPVIDHPKHLMATILLAVLLSAFVCLPIALTFKYQSWLVHCKLLEGGPGCSYIDSRIAFFPFCVALCGLFWLINSIGLRLRWKSTARVLIATTIGLISSYSYLHNWRTSELMKNDMMVWSRAAELACTSTVDLMGDEELLQKIDPSQQMTFHPDFNKASYWRSYIFDKKQSSDCSF